MKYGLLVLLLCFSLIPSAVFCFDNNETHPKLTTQAILSARMDAILKQNLGITKGINQALTFPSGITSRINSPAPILEIIKDGAYAEDIPMCRAANHFHDPIKNMGLSDVLYSAADPCGILTPGPILFPCSPSAINVGKVFLLYCAADGALSGQSYVPWSSTLTWATASGKNEWDWNNTRFYYYSALTENDPIKREENFAKTFKGLGYILHLLQDMAVPAHVRNDFVGHVVPEQFEKYVSKHSEFITQYPAIDITNASYTNFWDSDLYNGTNPAVTAFQGGLAEYTNANFLSKNTMLTEDYLPYGSYYFPYPSARSTVLWKDNTNNKRYLRKNSDGETVEHLAVSGLLDWYRLKYFPQENYFRPIGLDEKCFSEYASKLIPRAVGYSAGLLNYFFRGDIDIFEDTETDAGYVIENNSDEDMSGTFELWYDNKNGERLKVFNASWALSINKKSSGNNKSTNIVFNSPTDIKEKNKYILVFRGKMGSEEDAVIGKKVELKGLTYTILADIYRKILPFRIKILDSKYKLLLEDKNLNIQLSDTSSTSYNLVLRSNTNGTHVLSYPESFWDYYTWRLISVPYKPYIKEYGVYRPSEEGCSSCYYGQANTYWKLYEKKGNYQVYASGRHNFTMDTQGIYLTFEDSIWRDATLGCSSNYVYRYTIPQSLTYIDGQTVATDKLGEGSSVYISGQGWTPCTGPSISNEIIAALGNNKAMIINTERKRGGAELIGTKILWTSPVEDVKLKEKTYSDDRTSVSKLKIGEEVIDSAPGGAEWKGSNIYFSTDTGNDWGYIGGILNQYYPGGTYSYYYSYKYITGGLTVLDYDNLYGDDMFIVLYTKTQSTYAYEGNIVVTVSQGRGDFTYDQSGLKETIEDKKETYIAYKTPTLGIQKVLLYTTSTNYMADIIWGVSSQMNKDMMVYTYIVKKWDGTKHVFDKRVVGLINISDTRVPIGYRQEFEITNENSPVANFDFSQLAAIGIHKIE